ncbi:MAG TPA: hypothetical protein PK490_14955 [Prosthecobacter sp.]|nr:hypothetical protein [Prosthecobacter sp.]
MTQNPPKSRRPFFGLMAAAAVLTLTCVEVQAQYGVSPSQTGMFFDDLRARQRAESAASASGARDGNVVYDYDSGIYRATGNEMGQRSTDYQSAREVSRPSIRSGSNAFSARTAGDYTNYAGQYTSPTGFFAPTYISDPFLSGRRNVRLGPVNVGFGFYQGIEYNDNVNRSGVDPVSDVITSTLLNIDANYQVTQNNRLSISTALGFDNYWNHPELSPYGDGNFIVNVLPGSTIAFDIKAGPVYFTVYDRISVRPAVRNDFALTRNQVFGVFQNDVGVAANWRINSAWSLSVNLMHSDSQALGGGQTGTVGVTDEDNFSRTTDSIHASLTFSPTGTWVLGMEGGVTDMQYDQEFNADGVLSNIGAFVVLPVAKSTYIRVAGGWQNFEFDEVGFKSLGTTPLTSGDTSDLSDFYYSVTLSNQLNSRVSHSLTFGREAALNVTSNYVVADYLNYGISFIAWKGSRIALSAYVEDAEMSGGVFAQETLQYGMDIHVSHRVTSKLTAGVGYHYGRTDTDRMGSSNALGSLGSAANFGTFDQHAWNVDLTYALNHKASLIFGYRYYLTDMLSGPGRFNDQDFTQNRLIMGFNYNF